MFFVLMVLKGGSSCKNPRAAGCAAMPLSSTISNYPAILAILVILKLCAAAHWCTMRDFQVCAKFFRKHESLDKRFLIFSVQFSTKSNDQVRITLLIFLVTLFYGTQFSHGNYKLCNA